MRSIDRLYYRAEKQNPLHCRTSTLWNVVAGKRYSAETIARAVNRLIPPDDYLEDAVVKKQLITDLTSASNPSEDTRKEE